MPRVTALSAPDVHSSCASTFCLECFHSCPLDSVTVVTILRKIKSFATLIANLQLPNGGRQIKCNKREIYITLIYPGHQPREAT